MTEIIIPEDWFEGKRCLELGIPWWVPEAIHFVNERLRPEYNVLEIGAGGSTIFFSNRCAEVFCIETSNDWAKRVSQEIENRELSNAGVFLESNEESILDVLKQAAYYNVLSVDPQGGYNRSKMFNAIMHLSHLRMIILDNYAHPELFPDHWDRNIFEGNSDWEMFTFDFPNYAGNGTRIYLKKSINNG